MSSSPDLEAGCKPAAEWRIGTEHEKFVFRTADHAPVAYEGDRGIRVLLELLRDRFAWDEVLEKGNIIALRRKDCPKGGSVSLEPGGQLELSGAPLDTVHQMQEEIRQHLAEVGEVGKNSASASSVSASRRNGRSPRPRSCRRNAIAS